MRALATLFVQSLDVLGEGGPERPGATVALTDDDSGWTLAPATRRSSTVAPPWCDSPMNSRTWSVLAASISTMPSRSSEAEHRREPEAAEPLDQDGPRGPGRRADAVLEEGETRPGGTADDRAGAAAFDDASRELERVHVVDLGDREWLAVVVRAGATRHAVESATHDHAGQRGENALHDGDNRQVGGEVDPEVAQVKEVKSDRRGARSDRPTR